MTIEIYSDGSGTNAESSGGWAFVICVNGIKVIEEYGSLSRATNNVAEVTAAIRGLEYVATTDLPGCQLPDSTAHAAQTDETDGTTVVLISDSQLTLKWATGEYRCKKWHLIPDVIKLRKLLKKLNAETRWVRGHSGNEHNERCDELAGLAREALIKDKQ